MEKKYIIGVDGGSQSSKIVIVDLEGTVICSSTQTLQPTYLAEPGIVEHPDDDLWDSIVVACKETMAKFTGDKKDIIGVGLGSIRFCRALLKKDGSLAQPVMSWMDARVSRPHDETNPEVAYVTTATGYITHRFTGEFNDTVANYQGIWPIDTDTWDWLADKAEFDAFNIPREMLFKLKMPGDVLGSVTNRTAELTGIPAGIPVIATANDKAVEALGAGLKGDEAILISLGTYIASMVEGKENPKGTQNFWTNFACEPHKYLYESTGIRRGMWTVSWFKEVLGDSYIEKAASKGLTAEELLNTELKDVPAGSDGLMTILDWLAPTDALYKKGAMLGFDGRHGRAHIYRSILEAIALTMKNHGEAMCDELGKKRKKVIISGGGSNSDVFMQIFADVFGIPAQRNVVNGSASLGAAISVAVALNYYKSYEEATAKMVQIQEMFEPIPENVMLYDKMNQEVYRNITDYTDGLFKKTYPLFN
ncbi:FGGY-family carbohydrate kinase [Carnobacterium gallinarum]|uniref:FGGY-family carbohydrate kinase n=1 Tax=Carnobacterium gallinarum TaxID=2749 RepID=UPI00054DBFD7|nr:FGGY family carbohydrate kinase [Carnobacterium gallinarum]